MDKIIMHHLSFYGYHGVLEEEKRLGQKFILDIELWVDLALAGATDHVDNTVSYADVYEDVKELAENQSFHLIEALAEHISHRILEKYGKVKKVMVRVKKPEAPVKGIFDYFGVEIERSRDE